MPTSTSHPVRYSNGGATLYQQDLPVSGGGFFGHERRYYNQVSPDYDGPNGYDWWIQQWPYAVVSGSSVAIVFDPDKPYWFDLSGGVYSPRYGTLDVSLTANTTAKTLTFIQTTNGRSQVTVFNDSTVTAAPGALISHTDARGVVTTVTTRTGASINETQRTYTLGGVAFTDSLQYAYVPSGTSDAGRLQSVTFRQKVGTGSFTSLRRAAFDYYGSANSHGGVNDLRSAQQQVPNGSGGWNVVAVNFYRYWLGGSATGFAHALKMRLGPEAYRQVFNAGINLTTASDATLLPYADEYFEYTPATRRVTKEVAAVCASCPGGGTTTDLFAYSANPRSPTPGYNVWSTKTVQTLPDGSTITVYTNYVGRPMLYVYTDSGGSNRWATFYLYDNTSGLLLWEAQPSAVALPASLSTIEAYDDLLNLVSGSYQYLNSTGLIKVYGYYATTNLGLGQVQGYRSSENVRQGQGGSNVLVRSYTYTSHTFTGGPTVYPLASVIDYPDASNPATTITTSYAYTWYSGTNTVSQATTTLPAVPSGQNGSGTSATIVDQFDANGNLTQRTDERGTVNTYSYAAGLGLVTQQVLNYQVGVTQPGVNVTTDFTYDSQGALVQVLGPSHTALVAGAATTVRRATWYVSVSSVRPASGTWGLDEDRAGQGYATGTGPSYTYTLVDPVNLTRKGKDGRRTDRITSKRTSGSGSLAKTDTFAQSDWKTWSSLTYNAQRQLASQQTYFLIPASGAGTSGTNYAQTVYGYDALERRNRVVSPEGTITRSVWTAPQRVASVWVGTNDTGATDANPAGSGSPNNMVIVAAHQYDGGSAGGNGNLTQVTEYASASDTRAATYGYDWRNRRTSIDGEIDLYVAYTYDNLSRITQIDRRNTTSGGNLVGRSQVKYDDRSRVYQQILYAVDPATGTLGNAVTANRWFDDGGNVVQQVDQGAGESFVKWTYNGVRWVTATYRGYNTSGLSHSQATTVANDMIYMQSEPAYDEVGNVISIANFERLNDATGTGALSYGTQPKARVSYGANWYDGINRPIAAAHYGSVASFARPGTVPSRSDDVLVSETAYDDAGRIWKTIDPRGIENRRAFDAAGRTTQTVDAYDPGSINDDTNRTTNYTYTLDNQVATLTAVNARTGDQTTTYTYGTTLTDSAVARNDLLRYTAYPDSSGSSDRTAATYNRLKQRTTFSDQRGTVHSYDYDKLGRLAHDRVITVGSNTDNAVLRISVMYEVRGMVQTVTSYNNATVGSGAVLDQVKPEYNSFGQLAKESQDHTGAVGVATPSVQYAYASGASNSNLIRRTTMTYPDARAITYDFGATGTAADRLSRINAIKDGATSLAAYTYLGSGMVIRIDYPQPQVRLDLWGGTSGTFAGLDHFNRIKDQRWLNYNTSTDLDRYQYGYDRNNSRAWKQNPLTTGLDEFYTYDQLNRLASMDRGTLNGTKTGIAGTPAIEQDWTLDPTGNWRGYLTKVSGTTDLNQSRTSNPVNEITAITETAGPSWIDPAYDAAGNTTTFPKPSDPTQSLTATYDAWGRMAEVKDAGITVARYNYDGRSRRIVMLTYAAGVLTETRHVYYTSGWRAVEERIGSSTTADRQYVWGVRYIDELVCRDDATPQRTYATQDANFNVTGLVTASGSIVQRFVYEPYGADSVRTANWTSATDAYAWEPRFQGGRYGAATGLYHFRMRYYSPTLGRWGQRDRHAGGPYVDGMNAYQHVGSNPINRRDPSGLFGEIDGPHDALVHYLIGAGTDAYLSDGMIANLKQQHFYRSLMQEAIPNAIQGLLPSECDVADEQRTASGVLTGVLTAPIQPDANGNMGREDFYSFELNNAIGTINSISWKVTCTAGSGPRNDEDCCCLAYAKSCKVEIVLDDVYTFNTGIKDKLFQWTFGDFMGGQDYNIQNKWTESAGPETKKIC